MRRLGGLLIDLNPELHRTREPVLRPGEWITFEIIAEGNHFVIKVNGETTCDYTDDQQTYTSGYIVLQNTAKQRSSNSARSRSRSRRLKSFARESRSEFVPLFNGKDLTGWEGLAHRWTLKDGAIVGSTPQDGLKFNSFLCSKNKYKDFELKFQVKLTGTGWEGNSGVQIRSELKDKDQFVRVGPAV